MFFTSKDKVNSQDIKEKIQGQEYKVIIPAEKILDDNGQEIILYKLEESNVKELNVFDGGEDQ